jgi:hypothetical protein
MLMQNSLETSTGIGENTGVRIVVVWDTMRIIIISRTTPTIIIDGSIASQDIESMLALMIMEITALTL